MSKKTSKKKKIQKSHKDIKALFGGLSVHELEIQPINVFALKVEHCEEPGYMGGCAVPVGPAPVG